MSTYMDAQNARIDPILANFAAGFAAGMAQRDQLDSVLLICAEVERHCNVMDPADPTAASVLVELNLDLVTGLRILTKVVREKLQVPTAKGHCAESELPVSLMDEVPA